MTEIYTAGYEAYDCASFIKLLNRCGIELLADVRELPISRKKGFAKSALSALCAQSEIDYAHFPALGCPRTVRYRYREDNDWGAYTVDFKSYIRGETETLLAVAELAQRRRICLLCYEEDFNFCHRTYVAEAMAPLIEGPVRIFHLTGPIKGRVVDLPMAQAA